MVSFLSEQIMEQADSKAKVFEGAPGPFFSRAKNLLSHASKAYPQRPNFVFPSTHPLVSKIEVKYRCILIPSLHCCFHAGRPSGPTPSLSCAYQVKHLNSNKYFFFYKNCKCVKCLSGTWCIPKFFEFELHTDAETNYTDYRTTRLNELQASI